MISEIIHPVTAAKISFLTDSERDQLKEYISPDQLEEKYGGNLPDLKEFWPPRSTFEDHELVELNHGSSAANSKRYHSRVEDFDVSGFNEEFRIIFTQATI